MFDIAVNVARTTFAEEHNGVLGEIKTVYRQVVAGINYTIIFATEEGDFEVKVFVQPWTETYRVL